MSKRKRLNEVTLFNLKKLVDDGNILHDSNFDNSKSNIEWLNSVSLLIKNLDSIFQSILVPIVDVAYLYRHDYNLCQKYMSDLVYSLDQCYRWMNNDDFWVNQLSNKFLLLFLWTKWHEWGICGIIGVENLNK